MNRKEMVIVVVVLLLAFIGGAYAAPSIQEVFVTNFPPNQKVTVTNFPTTNTTVQTFSVLITLSPTGCPSVNNCWLFNASYPVTGWRTVTISSDTSLLVVEFATRGILSIASVFNPNSNFISYPCAIANPAPGSFGLFPQCTIQVTGNTIWIAGNSPGHVALFLQK